MDSSPTNQQVPVRALLAHAGGQEYTLLVASERLLHPDLLARTAPAGLVLGGPAPVPDEPVAGAHWLLDDALQSAADWRHTDAAGNARVLSRTALDPIDHSQWLSCTVPLAARSEPNATASSEGERAQVNATIGNFTQRRIAERLDATLSLPPLSATTRELLELRNQPFGNAPQLLAIIEKDAALAARLVGLANSAYYAAPGSVRSIHDAVVRVVGFDAVLNLALGLGIGASVPATPAAIDGVPGYWAESLLTAATMENLAARMQHPACEPGTAYLCGLLAHFGTLLLAHVFAPQFEKIRALQIANRHLHYACCDQAVLELSRDSLAAELLRDWQLPDSVVTAIRMQSAPEEEDLLGRLLQFTRRLLAAEGLGSYPLRTGNSRPELAAGLMQDDVDEVLRVLSDSAEDIETLSSLFHVETVQGVAAHRSAK